MLASANEMMKSVTQKQLCIFGLHYVYWKMKTLGKVYTQVS